MANTRNFVHETGRLTRKPVFFQNDDGSHTVRLTVAVRRNYISTVNGNRGYNADFIEASRYISKEQAKRFALYEGLDKGDLISFNGHLESAQFTDKSGQTEYVQRLIIDDIDTLLESKQARTERADKQTSKSDIKNDNTDDPFQGQDAKANGPY